MWQPKMILYFVVALALIGPASGCVDTKVKPSGDTDSDTDSDSDSDSDTDSDTDSDSDSDSDSDTDTDSDTECVDPVVGAPSVTSDITLTLQAVDTSGTYQLTFSEDVENVDGTSITWTATSGGSGVLDSITEIDAATYDIAFSGVSWNETYTIDVSTAVTDVCGNPLQSTFTAELEWATLSCPLPNSYTTGIPFDTNGYNNYEYCTSSDSAYRLWDLSGLGAVALCITGTYDVESGYDDFFVKNGSGTTLFTGSPSGSYNQLVQDDQAITCVDSDGSITYDGYTVTAITWI
jgi:hypothetical protein